MKLRIGIVAALLIVAPASAALAAPGVVRHNVSLRAGPGGGFPVVDRIPAGGRVTIHGCLNGGTWCDVSFDGERGWVSAAALGYLYRHRTVALTDYVDDIPVVPFALSSYWASYYVGRPWYHRHAHWDRYWHRHPPVIAHGRGPHGHGPYGPRPHDHLAGRPDRGGVPGLVAPAPHRHLHGGFAHRAPDPNGIIAIGHRDPSHPHRFGDLQPHRIGAKMSPGLTARPMPAHHFAQPQIGRPAGPPMAAHAQMGGPRGPIGGVPRIGGVPHIGGGPVATGGHPGGGPRGGFGQPR